MILTIYLRIGEKITIHDPEGSVEDFNKISLPMFDQGFIRFFSHYQNIIVPWDNVASIIATSEDSPIIKGR